MDLDRPHRRRARTEAVFRIVGVPAWPGRCAGSDAQAAGHAYSPVGAEFGLIGLGLGLGLVSLGGVGSGRLAIFVDQAAEDIDSFDAAGRRRRRPGGAGHRQRRL
jgi:hypothetical protein